MFIAIRISGMVEVPKDVDETLFRMRLRRKYSAVLLHQTAENLKLLKLVRDFVAYGVIDNKTLVELIEKRGKKLDGSKIRDDFAERIIVEMEKGKTPEQLGLKPFFRLHSPRGGINSKAHFPVRKGVLGDNKEKINDLVRRML